MSGAVVIDRDRLVKLLGMLGSAHDGEVAAAGRAADRLVREAGLRWPDIIPAANRDAPDIASAISIAIRFENLLTDWESQFVRSLRRQRRPASDKQRAILAEIIDKVKRAEARAA